MTAFALFLLALFAARVQHYATLPRRSRWNGYNTIQGTLDKNIDAPMVYRVLLPIIVTGLRRVMDAQNAYETARALLLWLALVCVNMVWGWQVAVLWLVFVMSAQIYDTWCYTGEVIGISLALSGDPALAVIGVVAHGMSRETVLINGFVYWLATGDALGGILLSGAAAAVFHGVRLVQGRHPLYCDRFQLRANWELLTFQRQSIRNQFEPGLMYAPYLNLIVIALALMGAWLSGPIGWAVPAIVATTVTMGKINEYRLQIAVMPWAAIAVIHLLTAGV